MTPPPASPDPYGALHHASYDGKATSRWFAPTP
ncbi:hypothetical protein SBADM41S_03179 [Streptomyces badius]